MKTVRRYNYRMYPTKGQRAALSRLFGACRFAWNWYVRQRMTDWNFNAPTASYAELSAKFNRTKAEPGLEWLGEVSAVPLAQSLCRWRSRCASARKPIPRSSDTSRPMDTTSTARGGR